MKIIINADDFGFTEGTNEAVFELARLGTLTSTTVMVNMPFAEEAVKLLNLRNFSVGLHLNLTQGSPVSPPEAVASLIDGDGQFFDLKELSQRAKAGKVRGEELLTEMEAQYGRLREILGDRITHMDSHQGLNRIPFIFKQTLRFLRKHPLNAVRFYIKHYAVGSGESARIEKPGLLTVRRYGLKRLLVESYLKRNLARLRGLTTTPDGMLVRPSHDTLELFRWLVDNSAPLGAPDWIVEIPCHPAANTEGLVDTKYTEERVREYAMLKSPDFVSAAKRWRLVDYTALYG